MSPRDEFRDPWGWLVAVVSGVLGWVVLGDSLTGPAGVAVPIGIGVAVLSARVAVGAIRSRPQPHQAVEARDRLPRAPADSRQAALLVRSHAAVRRMQDLVERPSDPWIAGELRLVIDQSHPVVAAVDEMSGRVTVLDTSISAARPYALAQEIATLQERMRRTTDPQVRREQQRALTALDAQADSIDRLLRHRDTALAQMQACAVGLESLATRGGELLALGPAALDTQEADRIVADLSSSLDAVQAGVEQARTVLRDL